MFAFFKRKNSNARSQNEGNDSFVESSNLNHDKLDKLVDGLEHGEVFIKSIMRQCRGRQNGR